MKIVQINYSKERGGAAKACLRIHRALRQKQVNSKMLISLKPDDNEEGVICYNDSLFAQGKRKLYKVINLLIVKLLQKTKNQDLHTFDTASVISPDYINKLDADIVHLHWVNYSTLGIKSLRKISKPIVWTFHDMWAFMGCEHYDDLNQPLRFVDGYTKKNKNVSGIDMNRIAWKMKKKYWKNIHFNIITPSNWLKTCVENSSLLKDANVELIPYIIDEEKFYKKDKTEVRKSLSLPIDKKLILFGAFNANNINKGGDLLFDALKKLNLKDTELIVFGTDKGPDLHGLKTTYTGYIKDEAKLNDLYNAADLMVVPSRQDNLPNTVLESICCGTPVVGFSIGGLIDMVIHKNCGYLAEPYNTDDLKNGIEFILENQDTINFHENCRSHFKNNFSKEVVIPKIIDFYKRVIESAKK